MLFVPYIYKITNSINDKVYIGKTSHLTIEERFKEHIKDSQKERHEKRPLYDAMNKYGIENFVAKELIECEVDELSSYEIMFIEKLQTYGEKGYNATKGGDGSILFDYNEIVNLYKQGKSMIEVASIIHCCADTVSKVIHLYNLPINKIISGSC
jgi:group I intron endonuclease